MLSVTEAEMKSSEHRSHSSSIKKQEQMCLKRWILASRKLISGNKSENLTTIKCNESIHITLFVFLALLFSKFPWVSVDPFYKCFTKVFVPFHLSSWFSLLLKPISLSTAPLFLLIQLLGRQVHPLLLSSFSSYFLSHFIYSFCFSLSLGQVCAEAAVALLTDRDRNELDGVERTFLKIYFIIIILFL